MAGYDAARTSANAFESGLSLQNVNKLDHRYTATVPGTASEPPAAQSAPPAVANGLVYVATDNGYLSAYSAAGTTDCRGIPPVCGEIWDGTVPASPQRSSPTVDGGTVYLGATDGKVYAFDGTHCISMPFTVTTCKPARSYAAGGPVGTSPAVVNGIVYVAAGAAGRTLYAFDAKGAMNCLGSPLVCTPLWSGTVGAVASDPTVAAGRVYVGAANGKLYAFDANGGTNCTGSPRVCTPLWTAAVSGATNTLSTPAFSNNVLYTTSSDGRLYAARATDGTVLWRSTTATRAGAPAVANRIVYSATSAGIEAFDAVGATNCAGSPKTCTQLWTAVGTMAQTPTVANGVLYVGENTGTLQTFDAAGVINCVGAPKTCTPLSTTAVNTLITAPPVVANGAVYIRSAPGSTYGSGLDAYALVGPRIYATAGPIPNSNQAAVGADGDHFPPSTNGTVTFTNPDQNNEAVTANFITDTHGAFTTSTTMTFARCGDTIDVTATAGTGRASYRTFVECQI